MGFKVTNVTFGRIIPPEEGIGEATPNTIDGISHYGIFQNGIYNKNMRSIHTAEYHAFLKKLICARKAAKLSQAEVAKLLGKAQSFVSKSESGERRVDIIELSQFAQLYKKPLSYFTARTK